MISELASIPVFSLSKMTLLRTFPILVGALSLCSSDILAYLLSLGASRCTLLSIQLVFLLAHIPPRLDHAVSLWRSLYLYQPWLPRWEFCLGRKLSSLYVMDSFLSLCLSWSFAVYLEYLFSWCDVWRVLRWWPVQQFFTMFPPTLQLVFITGKYKYIVILMFDRPICVFVLSCYIIQLFHVSLG